MLVLSFAATILIGSFVLWLPISREATAEPIEYVDALFTSTSAVCVTGLATFDPASRLSPFGEGVLLFLIQVGGLGVLTISTLIMTMGARKFGLGNRMILSETYGSLPHVSPFALLREIFIYTMMIEGIGVALLFPSFAAHHPPDVALHMSVFHAVSAFCNAGFSLYPDGLMRFRGDLFVTPVVMGLIILGGLGFLVYGDLTHMVRRIFQKPRPRLSLQTRVVTRWSLGLIVTGMCLFVITEIGNPTMAGTWYARLYDMLFLSVTSRTAGFNTVDTGGLTSATLLIVILLMAVGASPGSTGGGMKTTTLATIVALIRSRIRNRERVEIYDRSLPDEIVGRALATAAGFFVSVVIAMILLEITEINGSRFIAGRAHFLDHLFEVVSALCTVGLSTGGTAAFTASGKLVLIGCMFLGRVGPLVVGASVVGNPDRVDYKLPNESIAIG
jgi:trk system potassium uptake protein TrkH